MGRPGRLVGRRPVARRRRRADSPTCTTGCTRWPCRCAAPGEALLHLDLHPLDVILRESDPVVIDWSNAGPGPAALDVARTAVSASDRWWSPTGCSRRWASVLERATGALARMLRGLRLRRSSRRTQAARGRRGAPLARNRTSPHAELTRSRWLSTSPPPVAESTVSGPCRAAATGRWSATRHRVVRHSAGSRHVGLPHVALTVRPRRPSRRTASRRRCGPGRRTREAGSVRQLVALRAARGHGVPAAGREIASSSA